MTDDRYRSPRVLAPQGPDAPRNPATSSATPTRQGDLPTPSNLAITPQAAAFLDRHFPKPDGYHTRADPASRGHGTTRARNPARIPPFPTGGNGARLSQPLPAAGNERAGAAKARLAII